MTAHIQRLDRGRVRADLVQSGRLVDTRARTPIPFTQYASTMAACCATGVASLPTPSWPGAPMPTRAARSAWPTPPATSFIESTGAEERDEHRNDRTD